MMSSGMSGGAPGGGLSGMRGRGNVELARAHDPRGSLSKLFRYLGPHRQALVAALLLAVGSTAASIFGPRLLGEAVTVLSQGAAAQLSGSGAIDYDRIAQVLLRALGIYVLSAIFYCLHSWIVAGVATNISYRLRREISEKLHRLPLGVISIGVSRGDTLSRITNDVDTINQTLSQSMSQIVIALVTVVGVLIMMLSINWIMTLLALITVPLSMIASLLILRRSQPVFKQQQATLGQVNGQVEEAYGGHVVAQAFNQEEAEQAEIRGREQRSALRRQLEVTISLRHAHAGHDVCRQRGLRDRRGGRRVAGNPARRGGGRYPGLRAVRAFVHPADHPASRTARASCSRPPSPRNGFSSSWRKRRKRPKRLSRSGSSGWRAGWSSAMFTSATPRSAWSSMTAPVPGGAGTEGRHRRSDGRRQERPW